MKRLQVLLHQTLSFLFSLCLSEDLERPAAAGQLTNNSKASGASEMLPSIATSAVAWIPLSQLVRKAAALVESTAET